MCSHCFAFTDSRLTCPHCPVVFCNRLCATRARTSSHNRFICVGQNPTVAQALSLARDSRHFEAVLRIVAQWRLDHNQEIHDRVWSMCRVSQLEKEREWQEW